MRKTTMAVSVAALTAVVGGAWLHNRADAKETPAYRFGTVERGNLSSTVSATGALSAVRTVQVGTQVSGQVSTILVDFNDRVKKGQLLATIDPTLQRQAVQDAQAGLERTQAQLELAQEEYTRNKQLFDARIITAAEYGTVNANLGVAKANAKSAEIALSRARQNLAYTNIYSPIDGVIVERNVDVGQTVAASLSAPQLFLIANDLSRMQILASVDEGDIGSIKQGQPVRFTVQSFPNRSFTGTVSQVRLQSTTTENVVSYTAVVSVDNASGALLPGMTATLQFTTGSAEGALIVPTAALRFRPSDEAVGGARATSAGARAGATASGRSATAPSARAATGWSGTANTRGGALWYLDSSGKLARLRVKIGLTDGTRTVVTGDSLPEGMQIIVGSNVASNANGAASPASQSTTRNPLQPQGPGRPGGGRF